uniref:Nucleotide pyrophosphohydrolase n=1 Tax=Caldilinea aerophila TaxID=133453 RepID=A0A7C1FR75_9CHLR
MDTEVTVATLRQLVHHFVEERDWQRFHTPKNLAMSIAIETAELMEHFQWLSVEESIALVQDETARAAIAEELADLLIYSLSFANSADIDISDAIIRKMDRNQTRFPAKTVYGKLGDRKPENEE